MPLRIDKVSKRFKDKWVLRDIEFEVSEGEIFGIFGANGAGKSVLLRIITGKEKANGGKVISDSGRFSVFEMPKPSFVKSLFARTDSAEYTYRARELERFAAQNDGVLILDEPFDGLDAPVRHLAVRKLRDAAVSKGLTLIIATHHPEVVFEACDRALILYDRDVVQTGTPRELYENPVSVAAASALGSVNLIEARRLSKSNSEIPEFQTITAEHRVFAQKTEKHNLGAINRNVSLAIRPEHVSISFGASFPEDNLLRAMVTEVNYRGDTTLVGLDAGGLALDALVLRLVGLNIGDECMVGLPPDRIMVLGN